MPAAKAKSGKASAPDLLILAFDVIADTGWRGFSFTALAERADLSLPEIRQTFSGRKAVLDVLNRRLDQAMLTIDPEEMEGLPPRDRVFELMMSRLEAMAPFRPGLCRLMTDARFGTELIAIGHPSGFRFTVTTGIVSAVRKTFEFPPEYRQFVSGDEDALWVQTNAGISAGSSGGPLMTKDGNVVAINTWIAGGQNLGFAIHVKHLIDLQSQMATEASPLPLPGLGLFTSADVAMLIQEFNREFQHYSIETRSQESEEAARDYMVRHNPRPTHGRKLVDLAHETTDPDVAVEAVYGALRVLTDASQESSELYNEALELVREEHMTHSRMNDVALVSIQAMSPLRNDAIRTLLTELLSNSPNRDVRGVAAFSLAGMFPQLSQLPNVYATDRRHVLQLIADEYADVQIRGARLGEQTAADLNQLTNFAVGQITPDISGTDIDGKEFSLSDYAGKVTLIDFAADWCPHCRTMYPAEREMVERYADRPFVLLGVSSDEEATLRRLIDAETVTWRNWHDGPAGPISAEWNPTGSIPTFYLLDGDRRVRLAQAGAVAEDSLIANVEFALAAGDFALPEPVLTADHQWFYAMELEQDSEWTMPDFDRSGWSSGAGPLGFGNGDEATVIDESGLVTYYFRTTFDITSLKDVSNVVFRYVVDDGAVFYVNGKEFERTLLPADASGDTRAAMASALTSRDPHHVAIDLSLLNEGTNTIAVEVHQEHPSSADLRLEASLHLNAIEYLEQQLAGDDMGMQLHAMRAVRTLGPAAEQCTDELQALFDDTDSEVFRTYAINALADIDVTLVDKLKAPKADEGVQQVRDLIGYQMAVQLGEVVLSDQFSPSNYGHVYRTLRSLPAFVSAEYDRALKVYTVLAAIRAKDYEAARTLLKSAGADAVMDPKGIASLCMIEAGQGNTEKARKELLRLKSVMQHPEWTWETESQVIARETEAMMGQLAE